MYSSLIKFGKMKQLFSFNHVLSLTRDFRNTACSNDASKDTVWGDDGISCLNISICFSFLLIYTHIHTLWRLRNICLHNWNCLHMNVCCNQLLRHCFSSSGPYGINICCCFSSSSPYGINICCWIHPSFLLIHRCCLIHSMKLL
uniref:Uncharacterized protein n=1 Tax=Glycine max TaxID=3847 RepID=C6TEH4_SOYBN|nr:unknown [Glycine max]